MRGPDWPKAVAGQTIGLLGGSFDPAHAGHVAITREALRRFELDRVWWLVSPGNPLKPDAPAALGRRMAEARAVMAHPRVDVTAIEARLDTRYTADTLARLRAAYPGLRFVWLMGADNLAAFHTWDRWREIAATVPLGVLARPGERLSALRSVAARTLWSDRVPPRRLTRSDPPAWSFVSFPMRRESSSALRSRGIWKH